MYKSRKNIGILFILLMLIVILSFKLVFVKNKFITIKNQTISKEKGEKNITINKNVETQNKYGYNDILKCIGSNKSFEVKSINMVENEKCNVEIIYKGDIKLLNTSLNDLSKSKIFLNIDKISFNQNAKITNLNINFLKNK
ncbi:hypothetical protein [Clostridium psychrophilum]|uniref:hypothetical protein n=1 Tax=Clostridium psychrophilum TaxID=132926 RepID=UPI001C0E5A5D|nr:hypothetical protein [Clostridium psychrophilum]MBU3180143.1 hypothetical protein [Clostridium psychrophilum]